MYQNVYVKDKYGPEATVYLWDDEHEDVLEYPFEDYCYVLDPAGRYKTLYGQPASRRRYVRKAERQRLIERFGTHDVVFESDIRPETRVLVDRYTEDDEPSGGHRVLWFDIEVSMKPQLPDPEVAANTITSIAVYDSVCRERRVLLLSDRRGEEQIAGARVSFFEDETSLLRAFLDEWVALRPTIVVGYNSDRFDVPYVVRRLRRLLGRSEADRLSEIGVVELDKRSGRFQIAGVSSLDYLRLYKNFTFSELSSYSLDSVSKHELGRGKVAYKGRRYAPDGAGGWRHVPEGEPERDDERVVRGLDDLFELDPERFVAYNMEDVMLLVDLDEKLDFIELARTICHLGRVPYEDVYMSSRYIDGAILARLKQRGIVAPDRKSYDMSLAEGAPKGQSYLVLEEDVPPYVPYTGTLRIWKTESTKEEVDYVAREGNRFILRRGLPFDVGPDMRVTLHYEGAYVKDPRPGVHEWVFDLDLTSMYPSVMMSLNMSPETKVGRVHGWDADRVLGDAEGDPPELRLHLKGRPAPAPIEPDRLVRMLDNRGISIASNGALYRNDVRGVIPDILEDWFRMRREYKSRRNEYRRKSGAEAEELAARFDRLQHVHKIMINCFTPDHEIMTARGPVPVSEVEEGDMAYSINPDTMEVELRPVTRTYAQAYEGDMVEMKSSYVDLKVTPNHRMLTSKQKGDTFQPYEWREAGDLMEDERRHRLPPRDAEIAEVGRLTRDRIYMQEVCMSRGIVDVMFENGGFRSCRENAKLQPAGFDMADWAEFCGWYISEGSLAKTEKKTFESGNTRGESYNTLITQHPGQHGDRITTLLDRMGFSYKQNGNDLRIASKPLYKILEHDFGKGSYNKTIPDWMFGLPKAALSRLFDAMMAGDGDADGSRYTTVSRELAGQFIRLSHLVGRPGHLTDTADDAYKIGLPSKAGRTPTVKPEHREVVNYKGMIHCVEVEGNHTVLAGRNGKFNWVGQSVYGVSGLPTFRYYDIDNAEATTLTGQQTIFFSQRMGNRFFAERTGEDRDYCLYVDTDSVFFPALPIVRATRPEVDEDDTAQMVDAILDITSEVQAFINDQYDVLAHTLLRIPRGHTFDLTGKSHHFDIKQELIARSALWLEKKRYAQWIINEEGRPVDDLAGTKWDPGIEGVPAGEHDVKGLDIVRSDFAECFRSLLEDVTYGVLHFWDKGRLDRMILDFKSSMHETPLGDMAKPTGVNKMSRYATGKPGFRKKGTPVHVKAAMGYNELLDHFGYGGQVPPIDSGDKIRWVYLDTNPLGLSEAAFTGDGDPPEVMDFIRRYAAYGVMYEKGLERKVKKIYDAMGWALPSAAGAALSRFL